jgi:plasmid stabilization system protein ParE
MLLDFPRLGRIVPEYDEESLRELIVGSYRIFYRVDADGVLISAIWHGSRLVDTTPDSDSGA